MLIFCVTFKTGWGSVPVWPSTQQERIWFELTFLTYVNTDIPLSFLLPLKGVWEINFEVLGEVTCACEGSRWGWRRWWKEFSLSTQEPGSQLFITFVVERGPAHVLLKLILTACTVQLTLLFVNKCHLQSWLMGSGSASPCLGLALPHARAQCQLCSWAGLCCPLGQRRQSHTGPVPSSEFRNPWLKMWLWQHTAEILNSFLNHRITNF